MNRVATVFLVEAIILCLIATYALNRNNDSITPAGIQSAATLAIFNLLFIPLMLQLNGSLNRKLCLLTLGNIIGLCWNFIFNSFHDSATASFGETFDVAYMIFFPFLSSLWIVSFWSLSLTILRSNDTRKITNDY